MYCMNLYLTISDSLTLFSVFSMCSSQRPMASGQSTRSWLRGWPLTWRAMSRPQSGMSLRLVLPFLFLLLIGPLDLFILIMNHFYKLTEESNSLCKFTIQHHVWLSVFGCWSWLDRYILEHTELSLSLLVTVLLVLLWSDCQIHGPTFSWLWQGKGKITCSTLAPSNLPFQKKMYSWFNTVPFAFV